jgi:hypothetical protein
MPYDDTCKYCDGYILNLLQHTEKNTAGFSYSLFHHAESDFTLKCDEEKVLLLELCSATG